MSEVIKFKRAVKSQSRLRLGLVGPAGSGKTYTALAIAQHLGKKVGVIDTEHGSAALYADKFAFESVELPDYEIETYVAALSAAADAGFDVLIVDSLSHAWERLKDRVDEIARASYRGNTWSAWSEGTPLQKALIEALLTYPGHLIGTMRTKTEWAADKDEKTGKTKPTKVGLAPVQRDGVDYEFSIVLELSEGGLAKVGKTRWSEIEGRVLEKPGEKFAKGLLGWLNAGSPAPCLQKAAAGQAAPSSPAPSPATGSTAGQERPVEGAPNNTAAAPGAAAAQAPAGPGPRESSAQPTPAGAAPNATSQPVSPSPTVPHSQKGETAPSATAGAGAPAPAPAVATPPAPKDPTPTPPFGSPKAEDKAPGKAKSERPVARLIDDHHYMDELGVVHEDPTLSEGQWIDRLFPWGSPGAPDVQEALPVFLAAGGPDGKVQPQALKVILEHAKSTHGRDLVAQAIARVSGRKPGKSGAQSLHPVVWRCVIASLPVRQPPPEAKEPTPDSSSVLAEAMGVSEVPF